MKIARKSGNGTSNLNVMVDVNVPGKKIHTKDTVIGFHDKISDFFNPGPKWQEDKKDRKER